MQAEKLVSVYRRRSKTYEPDPVNEVGLDHCRLVSLLN